MDHDALGLVASGTLVIRTRDIGPTHLRPAVSLVRRIGRALRQLSLASTVLAPAERELAWGAIANPDVLEIGRAIERLLDLPPPNRRADPDGRYDSRTLARRLADTLRSTAERPSNVQAEVRPK